MKLALGLTTSVRWRNLLACLESVEKQRDSIDDILCVEDGLTHPNIERICLDYGVRYMRLPEPKQHRRLVECHNLIFTEAQGDIIVRASQDQVFGSCFFDAIKYTCTRMGPEVVVLPFTGYYDDEVAKGDHETEYFNPQTSGEVAWRLADRTCVTVWKAGLPLQDVAFDLVCSHDGVEWAWRLHKQGYRFYYDETAVSWHIGHEVYPTLAQSDAAMKLLAEKTNGEVLG